MSKLEIVNKASRALYRTKFKFQKHSPEILVAAGVVGVVASAVLACRATLKVNDTLNKSKQTIDRIHVAAERGYTDGGEGYSAEDAKKDLTIAYAHTGLDFVKLYAPAVILGALSITSIVASNNILRKRNVALAAAYTAVDSSFKDYRHRVVERFGKDLDRELKYNIKAQEVEETVVDENGEETVVKKTVEVIDPEEVVKHNPHSIIFAEGSKGWEKDPEMNKFFLLQTQNYANEILKTRGYLFLNEVYEMLGAPKTTAGQIVGWVYDEKHPVGDNYVDFGIWDIHDERKISFVNGRERNIILDFNIDGPIHELAF